MAFAVQVLAVRFTLLAQNFHPLLLDPTQFGNREDADGIGVHAKRRGDPHFAHRRIDTQMNVLMSF